ncbi:acyltransferase [Mucilaginibacter sp. UR6-11]|uniref:acyltransferase family protein n=1 Tax=Mucilaginibacter sp. UR6-11 TaxID=1435644 RepID=UPI001E60DCAC|nr:acyltransferase [Mucilaginibacter sp. UR6-11]MCC8424338.1 acyltransferase [Mucilaginibacter sp. UR6-11]
MQNLVNEAPAKKNYEFIDAIRGIAMMSIVAEHSVAFNLTNIPFESAKYWTFASLIQFTKFGTIAFFLLAGFLISEKFADYSPAQYLRRRISTTFGPWVFWTFVYILAGLITLRIKARIYHDDEFNLTNILTLIKTVYLYTSYWFIINFLISITILLIFRRYLYSWYLGGTLMAFTLFYVIDIHYEWIDPRHTTAILGFVFFLWMGAQLRKYWQSIGRRIEKVSFFSLFMLMLLTFGLSLYEITWLHGKSIDPFNTLRISNILFSLAFFAMLLKIKNFKFINYLKPRQTTYGIYLIHYILLVFLFPEIFMHLPFDINHLALPLLVLFKIVTFVALYSLTLVIVLFIGDSKAKKLVGV